MQTKTNAYCLIAELPDNTSKSHVTKICHMSTITYTQLLKNVSSICTVNIRYGVQSLESQELGNPEKC